MGYYSFVMISLATDAYKIAMAQAGDPLRRETFYLSFRRGGPQVVAVDLRAWVKARLAELAATWTELPKFAGFLADHGYTLSPDMQSALTATDIEIEAVPPGTIVLPREPMLTITGPSFLVSFLEPLLLALHYPIQIATADRQGETKFGAATCEAHREIVCTTLGRDVPMRIEPDAYHRRVYNQVKALVDVVGDPNRIFEVGMRSAVCEEQHRIALRACKDAGVLATSNVALAHELGMKPVGTMGHEHVQRYGDDLSAFRAMRDKRQGLPSYLLDTFHTIESGLPAARQVMLEKAHEAAIRYDSGDKEAQYRYACTLFARAGLNPIHILEDGFDLAMTEQFENLRKEMGLSIDRQLYGYGGHIVARPTDNPHTRDRVSAVYKLSATGGEPRMKFGNEQGLGKMSVPGRPVTWRRVRGDGPLGMIAQQGETVPEDYLCLQGAASDPLQDQPLDSIEAELDRHPFVPSPATAALIKTFQPESQPERRT